MINRSLEKDIIIRKKLLNFLLKFFSPRNRLILYLSQNLDMSSLYKSKNTLH